MPAPHRILVVDDEEKIRKSLSGLLQDNGYEVVTAKSGPECLQTMSSQDFDLVILDIVMPGMSGIEVLQGIKERYKDTEVIMITGYADKEKAIATFRLNAYGFIEKPFESSEILNIIAHCLTQLSLRKDIEKKSHELRESEEKFRAISTTAVDAILVMDNEGKISYWNPAAERIFGYTNDEAKSKELHLFLAHERYHKAYKKGFNRFKETGQGPAVGVTSEFFALRKDGTEFPIEVSTSAIQIRGRWHAVGIIRDITERRQAEEALRKSEEELKKRVNELEEFYGIAVGRELRMIELKEEIERLKEELKNTKGTDRR